MKDAFDALESYPLSGIKNIIFDFGGVIVDLDSDGCVARFTQWGLDAERIIGRCVQAGVFSQLEAGTINAEEWTREILRLSGKPYDTDAIKAVMPKVAALWNSMLAGVPQKRLEALLRLRKSYRTALLSNTNIIHWQHAQQTMFSWQGHRAEDFFDFIFLSYEMHEQKPGTAIFRKALESAGFEAHETLFIDDSAENCLAAESLGIRTLQVEL